MNYDTFRARINALIRRAGDGISVRFTNDTDEGRFYANCSDGTTIIGNSCNLSVTVRFGFGHQAMASI